MTPLLFVVVVFLVSLAAGFLGSLLGLGGGIIVIPALTLLLVDNPLRDRRIDRVGDRDLERRGRGLCPGPSRESPRGDVPGDWARRPARIGRRVARRGSPARWLYVLFGDLLGFSALAMLRKRHEGSRPPVLQRAGRQPCACTAATSTRGR